ncbi:MAG: CRISPR-associated endonuclease Cas3'', partial [Bacteroidota bacterium]|nr:CRISPR-associated endonuclease Cas3'' [Candidatus Kapabacteria bacterium]MDW8272379.1 CRISPR-associated endonuclease Cas3'' [Bacteroidota bacterium]
MEAVAHLRMTSDGNVYWHSLAEHLQCVAEHAARFAAPFNNPEIARYIGLLHDVGKFHPKWQQYIRSQTNENTSTEE